MVAEKHKIFSFFGPMGRTLRWPWRYASPP